MNVKKGRSRQVGNVIVIESGSESDDDVDVDVDWVFTFKTYFN